MIRRESYVYEGIQALRFIAAILVVVTHSTLYASSRLVDGLPVWSAGAAGVDIFFVISGFVMVVSSEHLNGRPDGASVFARNRLIRIVPLYWLVTTVKLIVLLLVPALAMNNQVDGFHVFSSYMFLPARSPAGELVPLLEIGWTLNFEMFFYAVFALALLLRVQPVSAAAVTFIGLSLLALFRQPDWPAVAFWCDVILLEFLAGMIVGRLALRGTRMQPHIALVVAVAGFCLLLSGWTFEHPMLRVVQWGLPATMIVAAVALSESWLHGRVPIVLKRLGDSSYSLYLIHPLVAPIPAALLARADVRVAWLSIFLSMACAVVASLVLYRLFERPVTRKLKEWLDSRRASTSVSGSDFEDTLSRRRTRHNAL